MSQAARQLAPLIDGCGRRVDHLRISVTSQCDLRCIYCQPHDDGDAAGLLTDAQRLDFIRFLHERYGLFHLRVTGGEPLLYRPLVSFIASVRAALPDLTMALTTNARLLPELGVPLRQAGLNRLNVSLDSLDTERYRKITGGALEDLLAGLGAATAAGFDPPRLNAVVLKGVNEDEIVPLARWAMARGSEIRYLEAMPIGPAARTNQRGFVPAVEIRARLAEVFELIPIIRTHGETAQRYRAVADDCSGVVGIISPISEPFCGQCRRIRLTADGRCSRKCKSEHGFPCNSPLATSRYR
ncbi:MAG: radical SAM protein, partial [bacterium]|nr:radical SAM protein [bacterium]